MCHSVKVVLIFPDKSSSNKNEWNGRKLTELTATKIHYNNDVLLLLLQYSTIICEKIRGYQISGKHRYFVSK